MFAVFDIVVTILPIVHPGATGLYPAKPEVRTMRAISIRQPYAEAIAAGRKRVEYRGARLSAGPLLILASKAADRGGEHLPRGVAVCVVELVRVSGEPPEVRWHLENPRRVRPIEARSYGWIVHVPNRRIRYA
jgi:hypothetical protein